MEEKRTRLQVSDPTCEELRGHHSVLTTNEKLKKTEKSTTLLRYAVEVGSHGKLLRPQPPPIGEMNR